MVIDYKYVCMYVHVCTHIHVGLPPIKKNFYVDCSEVSSMTAADVELFWLVVNHRCRVCPQCNVWGESLIEYSQ